ncbi:MAG: hypothetical protein RLZZ499_3288 [Cyanobacteriota bacterium]|jgi:hypothetical protein
MKKLPDTKELKVLLKMAKDFEVQIKEQSEIARQITTKYENLEIEQQQQKVQIDN